MKLSNLIKACSDYWVKKATQTVKLTDLKVQIRKKFSNRKIVQNLQNMIDRIGFDILQSIE